MHWQPTRRNQLVYITLAALWLAVMIWQGFEHQSVLNVNKQAMIKTGRTITTTLGLVVRTQRRFGSFTVKERLEPALLDLIHPGELDSISLLSPSGEQIASAGVPMEITDEIIHGTGIYWTPKTLILNNPVDLGTNLDGNENADARTTIVVTEDMVPPPPTNRMNFRRGNWRDRRDADGASTNNPESIVTEGPAGPPRDFGDNPPRRERRPPFGRPPWMTEEDYQALIQKRGVHSFVIGLSTGVMNASNHRDLWMRLIIALLAAAAAGVSALAWRNVARSAELQIRLVKAGEMNTHLKEMNLAAAGLAHETRNPLNLIRGLAQMISRQSAVPDDVRDRSNAIVDEADRVTAQLNEFINYSRPREIRRGTLSFEKVAHEVARALAPDAEDKNVEITVTGSDLSVEADDQMLRQVLFNLVMNAIQASEQPGTIEIVLLSGEGNRAVIEVRDQGPGVSPENRTEIFKPYFTMHQNGTGLGLSVVQQIVSAHGWEIECVPNEPTGAIFRITHVKQVRPNGRTH